MVEDLSKVRHATALINPVSSSKRRGQKRLQRLIEVSPFEISPVTTSKDDATTKELIRASLENSDLLLIISGDGTFNTVVRTIISNNLSEKAKTTPIWSLGGGNAEDGTKATHSKLSLRHPEMALNNGRIVETRPIRFDITLPNDEHEMYPAAFYATLGASALVASNEFLNRETYRRSLLAKFTLSRSLSELPIGIYGLLSSPRSLIRSENGTQELYDFGYVNTRIMAKYLRFPTDLTKAELFRYQVPTQHDLLRHISKSVICGQPGGEYISQDQEDSFVVEQDILAQFDGEARKIPAQSQIRVSIHDQPLHLVVTKPNL